MAGNGRVLIVDDDVDVCMVLQRSLREYEVVVELSGEDALRRIVEGQERFDLIVCDLMMPRMTGVELHRQLEELVPDQAAAIIFVTGGAFTTDANRFVESTHVTVIEKPFDVATFRALVAKRLAGR